MDKALTINPSPEEAAQLQQTLSQCLAEIDRLREQMSRDDIEITRSQIRTRALLAEIKAMRTPGKQKAS